MAPGNTKEAYVRRRWRRWILLAGLIAGLAWLNGPGLRWLAPKVAGHFLSKQGFRGSFELEGNLTGGLRLKDLRLESDKAMALFTAGQVVPDYRLLHLLKGQLDGIVIDGLHADLRLGLETETPEQKKPPLDLEKLVKTIGTARNHVIQVSADLKDISLNITRDGNPVLSLSKSRIRHKAGDPVVDLIIGSITDATGRDWPASESSIIWNEDGLQIDRLDPLPGLSLRELAVSFPESGGPSAETELHVDEAVFFVTASQGLSSIQINLREGVLASEMLATRFGMKSPAGGELSSLSANVDNLLPDPKSATGSVQLLLEKVAYRDWEVPELSLDATLDSARATIAARAVALDAEISMDAGAAVVREDGKFILGDLRGHFNVARVAPLIAALSAHTKRINPIAPVPESTLAGDFQVDFSNNEMKSANVDLALAPTETELTSPIAAKARWQAGQSVSARLGLDGLTAEGEWDLVKSIYQGRAEFKDFKSARIDRWLGIFNAGTQGTVSLAGDWSGGGDAKEATHHGVFELKDADITRDGGPVHLKGAIKYDWPGKVSTRNLQLAAGNQSVTVDLMLADGFMKISHLLWRDGEREMATGSAKLPVPEDFSKWRDMPANDVRPLEITINSKVLFLAELKDWVPVAGKIDPLSTGRIKLEVSGTYAKPSIDALMELGSLRPLDQPKIPAADVNIKIAARDGMISMEGSASVPDFPPGTMTASMPFRPALWTETPGALMDEKISARADLPRIDLSRFTALIPGAAKLSGVLAGNIAVAGEIRQPEIKGKIDLTEGGLLMKSPDIPPVTGLAATVDLTLDKITLSRLTATVAGGALSAGGSLEIVEGKPGALDLRVKGEHLPVKRDESLIVRSNLDLRLSGSWQQAVLTGTAGVVDSIFFKDIELLPIGSPFTGPSAAALPKIDAPANTGNALPEPFRDWKLDLVAKTVNPFLIRGNLATGKVVANLRVGGTMGSPAPDGEVKISDFKATLPFSTLEVPSGVFRFTPANGFDPVLEIRGTAEPRPYRVNMFVYGKASDPELVLTSSPPLPENEIMTLLATGTTTTGLEDPQTASTRALQLFAEEVRRGRFGVGKQLRPLLGLLDRVDFTVAESDPYSSASYSTATLQLTDRWYLSAGMGSEGDSRILGIWRLRFY